MAIPNDTVNRSGFSRRNLIAGAAAGAAFSIVPRYVLGGPGVVPPSQKTLVVGVGMGGQGLQNMQALMESPEVQVVAVCDVNKEGGGYLSWNWAKGKDRQTGGREPARRLVDEVYSAKAPAGSYKGCRAYADWRELYSKEEFDGVMVATPDHSHAMITLAALRKKKHVYCEKPLTYSVNEARLVAQAAKAAGVATQMGNHGQATEEARVTCELIWDGAIGAVSEVQVWCPPRFWGPAPFDGRPTETPPVPESLAWDLFLGPAPERAYHPCYTPWNWRNWWDFGTGLLGDLGCHKLSTVFKALKLKSPIRVEACGTRDNGEQYPMGVIARFEFPARDGMPPVLLTWHDGGLKPPRPMELAAGQGHGDVLYIGDKGKLMGHRVIPESKMKDVRKPPKVLPRSPGHYKEWVEACRGGVAAGSNFVDHAGPLTEAVMLGNVALKAGRPIKWDGEACKVIDDAGANKLLQREYRAGWSL